MVTPRERDVLALIREDPLISQVAIARRLGISRSAVAGHVMRLTERGVIRGRGYLLDEQRFVVCVGGANLDVIGKAGQALLPGESTPGSVRTLPGGVARNAAETLARLGVRARLISAVGRDASGDFLLDRARNAGIDVRLVDSVAGAATSSYASILDRSGEPRLAVNDMHVIEAITADRIRGHSRVLQRAALVVADANLTEAALGALGDSIGDVPLFADTVSAAKAVRFESILDRVHTLKTTPGEARALAGGEQKSIAAAARWLRDRGVRRVFVTLGSQGVYFSSDDGEGALPARPPTASGAEFAGGAGDAFLATLAWGHLRNRPLADVTKLALAAAGHVTACAENVPEDLSVERLEALT